MATHQIDSLAQRELVSELRAELRRLRWSVWVRAAAIRAIEVNEADDGLEEGTGEARVRRSALLARQYAELDRIAEIEMTLTQANAGRIDRCQQCGAPREIERCGHRPEQGPGGRIAPESRPLAVAQASGSARVVHAGSV